MEKFQREQIDYLLCSAYNAAIEAGAKIVEIYTEYDDFFVSLKADSTPLTIADSQAHYIIKNRLSQTRIPLLSEEGRDMFYDERRSWDLYWLVDPLDGTEEFIKRNGEFTVNIALMVDNSPYLGVIYVPQSRTIYFSDPDRGSFCQTGVEPEIISTKSISEVFASARQMPLHKGVNSPIRVTASRSHESVVLSDMLETMRKYYGRLEVVEHGSSLKMCLVAEGSVDYYIRTTPTMEWDTAAGEAIARGAGVIVTDLQCEPLLYNEESLANPAFMCRTKYTSKDI